MKSSDDVLQLEETSTSLQNSTQPHQSRMSKPSSHPGPQRNEEIKHGVANLLRAAAVPISAPRVQHLTAQAHQHGSCYKAR